MWVDPQEEVDRKKLADQLNALETQDLGMDTMGMESMGSMNMENLTAMMEDKENMRSKPKVFMVSGWTDKEPSVEEAVKQLSGTISSEGHYDTSATHMLVMKMSRSEKMLGSVAAGKWVLLLVMCLPVWRLGSGWMRASTSGATWRMGCSRRRRGWSTSLPVLPANGGMAPQELREHLGDEAHSPHAGE